MRGINRWQQSAGIEQSATYIGHKRFNALKFQAVVASDGLILHLYGPVEGRRNDLTMFQESNLSEILNDALFIDWQQHYIYGDSA